MKEWTEMLNRAETGTPEAAEALFPVVYEELRRIAAAQLAREAPGQTLQPTALVHEAWMRLSGEGTRAWQGRRHFVSAASEAMRRILVDRARRKQRLKRGGDPERVELDESGWASPMADEQILEVNAALDRLEKEDAELAQIVKMRFFAGLNHDEAAAALGVNEKTVRRRWELARVRLFRWIQESRG
ncbi:MAG: sigma-70 family RNA polymerase sigma factor [Verrucomicrobiales bacterium]|nr:sigma-70 family RNA polymerase sigma factor [Verrucomicrobiales bacterium]